MKDTLKDALNEIDDTYIAEAAEPYRRNSMIGLVASLAAMLVLLVSVAFALGKDPSGPVQMGSHATSSTKHVHVSGNCSCGFPLRPNFTPTTGRYPEPRLLLVDLTQNQEKITGLQQIGTPSEAPGPSSSPPVFSFSINMVVEAQVKEVLPDVYQDPMTRGRYHVLAMETLDVINVDNMPLYFYLRLPYYLSTELNKFDSLILSLRQTGVENYLLINETSATMKPFTLMFDIYELSDHGDIIAFTNGVWDPTLWTLDGWYAADHDLNEILNNTYNCYYPVSKGTTVEECKMDIRNEIEDSLHFGTKTVYTGNWFGVGVELLDWVKPFQNGVYAQTFYSHGAVRYTRLINGFETNESIFFKKHMATRETESFTMEELSSIPDLGLFIADLMSNLSYMESPHADFYMDKNVTLENTWAKGKYYKVNGRVYGLVKVCWEYRQTDMVHDPGPGSYFDTLYYLIYSDGSGEVSNSAEIEYLLGDDFLEPEYNIFMPFIFE